ncbi:hypothetical protein KP509_09G017500 [Ceratopteris richardii]|uniref:Histone deacetylase n=1 Tax=Ceratopteris richardii TaxID=49495 RepID=A0A8T2U2A8_CERRI|nr:hypothetical protein KP509_09G017500 [Ceratopteris richardii]
MTNNSQLEDGVYVWYASYGSNMWKDRLLCYLQGGQVQGMGTRCVGARNKASPVNTCWLQVENEMFFGHSYTQTWGAGGVAFLDPRPKTGVSTHICLYKITLEQFNDLFLQENRIFDYESNIINEHTLWQSSTPQHASCITRTLIEDSWYGTILQLGVKDGIPILTFTCSDEDLQKFRSGLLPLCPPSEAYLQALARGLIEGLGLTKEDALSYLSHKVRTTQL